MANPFQIVGDDRPAETAGPPRPRRPVVPAAPARADRRAARRADRWRGCGAQPGRGARRRLGVPAKVAVILGLTVAAVVLYVGVAIAALSVPTTSVAALQVGTCLNGIHPGAAVDRRCHADRSTARRPTTTRSSASLSYTEPGRIPARPRSTGSRMLRASRLSASYVGHRLRTLDPRHDDRHPERAHLGAGDRQISCVAIARDGSQLTGSVKGSRR